MSPNPIADRAVPFVAPAIERVYRNSEHLRQICDRAEAELVTVTANLLKVWRSRADQGQQEIPRPLWSDARVRGSPTRGSLHDKPNSLCNLCRPTETYVHVGFDRAESEADLHRYAEACHDNHADA
jgi:hypothetical protein